MRKIKNLTLCLAVVMTFILGVLVLAACGDTASGTSAPSLPTVTPIATNTPGGTQTTATTTSATPATSLTAAATTNATTAPATNTSAPTATNAPPPTATPIVITTVTPAPAGTNVNISGVIQQIIIQNNITNIVVNNQLYLLDPVVLQGLGPRLIVGVPIKFVGRFNNVGQVIIINVVQINNQTVVINNPVLIKAGTDDENKDNDEGKKSNGNCEAKSQNGKCDGPEGGKEKGKDDKPKKK